MRATKIVFLALVAAVSLSTPTFAQTSLQDIQDLPSAKIRKIDPSKGFDHSHWAYKTLQNVSKKYGLLIGKPGEKFDGQKALTRNEAAVMLVNLVGKIEEDNIRLNTAEKAQLDILRNELRAETQKLVGRVAAVETSVNSLKGRVTELEKEDEHAVRVGFGKNVELTGGLQFVYAGVMKNSDSTYSSNFSIPVTEFGIKGDINDKWGYRVSSNLSKNIGGVEEGETQLLDTYVVNTMVPNHKIYLGQTRMPLGVEGTTSPFALDTVDRAMHSAILSNTRDTGIRVDGDWKYVDYKVGVYNGTRYQKPESNTDVDIVSWLNLKPLANAPQYGSLDLGSGFMFGKDDHSYNVIGSYIGYKYNKFALKSEMTVSDGYTGSLLKNVKANGYYIKGLYDVTEKIQLVGMFDTFDPNRDLHHNNTDQYTAGINYFMPDYHLQFMLNYVYVNKPLKNDSRILLGSQYIL